MSHYDFDVWIDYVRGDLLPSRSADLARHLELGCEACERLRTVAEELSGTSSSKGEPLQLPEHLLWAARVILGAQNGEGSPQGDPFLPPLTIDAVTEVDPSALDGVRSGLGCDGWQGVFYAGDVAVDLKMDLDPTGEKVSVVGQVAVRRAPEFELDCLPACLVQDDQIVSRALTNDVGEFELEYHSGNQPELRLGVPAHGLFSLRLDQVSVQG